jgi:hypothetical protein
MDNAERRFRGAGSACSGQVGESRTSLMQRHPVFPLPLFDLFNAARNPCRPESCVCESE